MTDELLLLTTGSLQKSLLARLAKRVESEISDSTLATELQEREAAGSMLSTFLEGSLITAAVDKTGIAVSVGSWRLEADGGSKGSETCVLSSEISNEA